MLQSSLFVLLGFVILVKGADWFVSGSVSLARHYKISELIIGLTVVAFGTSAPELVVNILSSLKGLNDVTLGNIVGSNLFNLLLILGISGLIYPIVVQVKTVWNEIPFSFLAAAVLLLLCNFTFNRGGQLSINRLDGVILLVFFGLFMRYILIHLRSSNDTLETDYPQHKLSVALLLIGVGLAALIAGSRLVVDHAVKIAHMLGASEKLIGVTLVSAGTSLPELVTSVVAAYRKKSDIAIGNIIGSNIFNIFLILGVSSIIAPIRYNTSFNVDILLLLAATLLLFAFMFSGKKHKLDRWESALLFLIYLGYVFYLLR